MPGLNINAQQLDGVIAQDSISILHRMSRLRIDGADTATCLDVFDHDKIPQLNVVGRRGSNCSIEHLVDDFVGNRVRLETLMARVLNMASKKFIVDSLRINHPQAASHSYLRLSDVLSRAINANASGSPCVQSRCSLWRLMRQTPSSLIKYSL